MSGRQRKSDMDIYRQGDVLILRTRRKVTGEVVERDGGRVVLAYGEVTGHAHAIVDEGAELLHDAETERRFLRVLAEAGVQLRHEEHAVITLPKGTYEIRRQREYAPETLRQISD